MTAANDLVARFARALPFDPDPFQHEAMLALARGDFVLVTAPTGAGIMGNVPALRYAGPSGR